MLYADMNGNKVRANPRQEALCPGCREDVIAKCGEINIWHWSHRAGHDCDPWYESETAWHHNWKLLVDPRQCEVLMGLHRADIVTPKGKIIELQHSPLSPKEVRERELFYKNMLWIIDASEFNGNVEMYRKPYGYSFRWKFPRKWMWYVGAPMAWDFGPDEPDYLFMVKRIYHDIPCGGWGHFIEKRMIFDL